MDPITASIIISAIGTGAGAAGQAMNKPDPTVQRKIAEMQEQGAMNRAIMQTKLAESMADPFRQQMFQGKNLSRLGMMQHSGSPTQVGPGVAYQRKPYQASPELLGWLSSLQQNIAGGQNTAPSVTGQGGGGGSVINLLDPATAANPGQVRGPRMKLPPPAEGATFDLGPQRPGRNPRF